MNYQDKRRQYILDGRPLPEKKKPKWLRSVSPSRQKKLDEQKEIHGDDETEKQKWFKARRKEMVGVCQCGCARRSSKESDDEFRASVAHIFPQRIFSSVQFHKQNWVERNFWFGCHSNMDNKSMDLWPNFADWDDIKIKFFILEKILTPIEKQKKFYSMLSEIIQRN